MTFLVFLSGIFLMCLGLCFACNGLCKVKNSVYDSAISIFLGIVIGLMGYGVIESNSNVADKEQEKQILRFKDIDKDCDPVSKTIIEDNKYLSCNTGEVIKIDSEEYNHYKLLPVVKANEKVLSLYNEEIRFNRAIKLVMTLFLMAGIFIAFRCYKNFTSY